MKEIIRKITEENYKWIGIRHLADDENYTVGDFCRNSYDWDYENDCSSYDTENPEELPEITPVSIITDDPWGKYNPKTNKYDAPNGGNDLIVPWERVVTSVKPYNSEKVKWAHTFSHAVATV